MNLEQIRKLAPQLNSIARKHGIAKVYIFGSVARGDATPKSDVDFLLEMQKDASLFGIAGFAYESEKLLGVSVDVIPLSLLSHVKDREFVKKLQKEATSL